ncbi:MAG: YggU family protein [Candidatus Methanoperedens sp.]|nr:YggU family protein [Candidatus Methanoperedens sp.]
MKDAVRQAKDGVILDLEISPGAKETAVHGYNPWRKRIEIRLSARAEKGKANAELILFLASILKVNSRHIQIITGSTNSKKSVKIAGMNAPDILNALTRK